MSISKKLDRILKKNLSQYDAIDLNDETSQVALTINDFKSLMLAIDQSFESNEIKTQQAERSLEISSRELAETNQKLFNMNNTMNTVLNSLEEGLVVFDRNGLCSKFSSSAGEKHFSRNFREEEIFYFDLFKQNESLQGDIKEWIDLLFSERFDFYQIHELGPNWVLTSEDRKIEIHYKPILDLNNKLEKILVITRDVTSEIQAKNEADSQKNMAKTIIEICNSPKLFQDMLESVHHLNSEIKAMLIGNEVTWNEAHDETFKRQLHTIKGATSSFNLKSIVEKIHDYETKYADLHEPGKKTKLVQEITHFIDVSCNHISSQFGFILRKLLENQGTTTSLLDKKRNEFFSELIQYNNHNLIKSFKEKFILSNFADLFKPYESVVEKLAQKLEKNILPIKVSSDQIYVLADNYKDLFSSFVHIFRNICDHGIETPDERLNLNKSEYGEVMIDCKIVSGEILLKISDDGRGIPKEKLLQKIKGTPLEKKYASKNILNCIFEPNLSTAEQVTELSGRGVGLSAVMAELQKLNGSVEVRSITDRGTTFEFRLPVIDTINFDTAIDEMKSAS